jgi:hypothetical protein
MSKKIIIIIIIVILGFISTGFYFIFSRKTKEPYSVTPKVITNFQECVNAGYPIGESYPRQCWTPDGKRFVEEIKLN